MQSTAIIGVLSHARAAVEGDEVAMGPLITAFAGLPDPRRRQGRRYPLSFLIGILVVALLCRCDTLEAVGQWCAEHRDLLAAHFPGQRFHTPTGSLYRRLLPRLSIVHLEAALAAWIQGSVQAEEDALALDGKTVRGAAIAGGTAPHLLSVSTHTTGETLLQVRVDEKSNEIPVARAVLSALPLAGRVVTADALHTYAATARALLDHGADYLLTLKRNQPTLYDECAAYFSEPAARVRPGTTVDRRRGRTETRTLYATTHLNAHLARYSGFPRLGQVACLLTTTEDKRGTHRDVRFLLTSLTPAQADPARLLTLARGHWSIESRHWVREVTFNEDRSPLRTGDTPQLVATLRNLAYTLLRRSGTTAIAAARRSFSYHPARALPLLLSPP